MASPRVSSRTGRRLHSNVIECNEKRTNNEETRETVCAETGESDSSSNRDEVLSSRLRHRGPCVSTGISLPRAPPPSPPQRFRPPTERLLTPLARIFNETVLRTHTPPGVKDKRIFLQGSSRRFRS
ncbi:hypothetical protein J6590_007369 [Homalodisca vitripennis]|nr:hypothetical protein J6590_007369 [Homalodisca vitripennis]